MDKNIREEFVKNCVEFAKKDLKNYKEIKISEAIDAAIETIKIDGFDEKKKLDFLSENENTNDLYNEIENVLIKDIKEDVVYEVVKDVLDCEKLHDEEEILEERESDIVYSLENVDIAKKYCEHCNLSLNEFIEKFYPIIESKISEE